MREVLYLVRINTYIPDQIALNVTTLQVVYGFTFGLVGQAPTFLWHDMKAAHISGGPCQCGRNSTLANLDRQE